MSHHSIERSGARDLVIQVERSIKIFGQDRGDIEATSDARLSHHGDQIFVAAERNCELWVPNDMRVRVVEVEHNLEIHDMRGEFHEIAAVGKSLLLHNVRGARIGDVGGNLTVHEPLDSLQISDVGGHLSLNNVVGSVQASDIGGHLDARGVVQVLACGDIGGHLTLRDCISRVQVSDIEGHLNVQGALESLHVDSVGGNATVRDVACDIKIGDVGGSLSISGARVVIAESIGGNADLQGEFIGFHGDVGGSLNARHARFSGATKINAGGHAELFFAPRDASESLEIDAGGHIKCQLAPDANCDVRIEDHRGSQVFRTGTGGSRVELTAGGTVEISGAADVDVRREMRDRGRKMGSVKVKLPMAPIPPIPEIKIPDINVDVDMGSGRRWQWSWPNNTPTESTASTGNTSATPVPSTDLSTSSAQSIPYDAKPVSSEERLVILRMLAERKITPEQADQLLAALE
jgi:hypothetical protein